jgi:glycosyltransferase involved in cell wall biosynthesis
VSKKVLNLISVPWYNGCADYALLMGRAQKALGMNPVYVGIPGSPVLERARALGFEVWDDLNPKGKNPFHLVASLKRSIHRIRDLKIATLFSHMGADHSFGSVIKGFVGRSITHVGVRADIRLPKGHGLNRFLYQRLTDKFIVPAKCMKDHFRHMGIESDKIDVLFPALDVTSFLQDTTVPLSRQTYGIPDSAFVFGVIARLDPVKGHRYIMRAMNLLEKSDNIYVVVSGEPLAVTTAMLKEELTPALQKRVIFLPRVTSVQALIKMLDGGLITSTGSEAVCRIAMEMMALGLPIVATDVNSIPETVVPNKGALVVPPNNPEALANAMEKLAFSPELCDRFSNHNQDRLMKELGLVSFTERFKSVMGDLVV